ncbi:MAG: hypothetical protein GF384_03430 [Elusimicrobia bacterium]|nr:hypothetical protein [Elusimicrobiota bacterium]
MKPLIYGVFRMLNYTIFRSDAVAQSMKKILIKHLILNKKENKRYVASSKFFSINELQ